MNKNIFQYITTFCFILLISSCGSDDSLTPNSNFTGTPAGGGNTGSSGFNADTDIYFTGDIGGKSYSFVDGTDNYLFDNIYIETSGVNNTTNVVTYCGFDEEDDLFQGNEDFPAFGVEYVVVLNSSPKDGQSYESKLGVGKSVSYGNGIGPIEGAVVRFFDENKVEWSSNKGSGDQTGSTFEITEFASQLDTFGDEVMIIRSKFSCILYNDNGDTLNVTGGTLRGSYITNSI